MKLFLIFVSMATICIGRPYWLTEAQYERVKKQLEIDEGRVNRIYIDSLGFRTFGVGHLVKKGDPEYDLPVGTAVTAQRVNEAFDADLQEAIRLTVNIYPSCPSWPGEVNEIMINMAFNLGGKLRQFVNLKRYLNARNWSKAADEMVNSNWYRQVGNRAKRLVARMRAV